MANKANCLLLFLIYYSHKYICIGIFPFSPVLPLSEEVLTPLDRRQKPRVARRHATRRLPVAAAAAAGETTGGPGKNVIYVHRNYNYVNRSQFFDIFLFPA
jgi:hypothetical protein